VLARNGFYSEKNLLRKKLGWSTYRSEVVI
jgi:hypothetical protein